MTEYFLGIDAGGTKTHAAIMDETGNLLGFGANGCGNWERVGLPKVMQTLDEVINEALTKSNLKYSDISHATFAMAGVDWESDQHAVARELKVLGFNSSPSIMNDAYAVLFAGTTDGIGCASIAGTGGKTVAFDGTRELATLGMSLGEGGGAGQIAAEGLQIVARMHHGQTPRTSLMAAVVNAAGYPDETAMFEAIAREHVALEESVAPLIFDYAAQGDEAAAEVVKAVAHQHAWDVLGLIQTLDFTEPIQLVRAGGLHTAGSELFNQAFDSVIEFGGRDVRSTILKVPPVAGSLLHAASTAGAALSETARNKLFASALQQLEETS